MSGPYYWPEKTVVTRVGQAITIELIALFPVCPSAGDPEIPWPVLIPLGILPAGLSTVTARYIAPYYPPPPSYWELTRTFAVANKSVASVPTDNRIGLSLLASALLILSCCALRFQAGNARRNI